jgi:hypothetical protein
MAAPLSPSASLIQNPPSTGYAARIPPIPPRPPFDAPTITISTLWTTLPEVEQLALREFLDENLNSQFIPPSAGPPVLFLRLAVDDRGLNKSLKR